MPKYVVKVLPKDSIKYLQEPIDTIFQRISETLESSPTLTFHKELKKPRIGFDLSSLKITNYGIKITYIIEKELIIPTVEGDVREFQKIAIPGKLILDEGVVLISNSSDTLIEKVSNAWAELLFPSYIPSLLTLKFEKEQFHQIIRASTKTVIQTSHTETKGLDKIQLRAFDLTNKEWYKEEFDSDTVDRISFIPLLPESFGGKTVICKMYRDGRFVIYQSAKFSEAEFEQIQLFLVKKIAEILGSPLCHYGAPEIQMKLDFNT
jgi:hypothetical protein